MRHQRHLDALLPEGVLKLYGASARKFGELFLINSLLSQKLSSESCNTKCYCNLDFKLARCRSSPSCSAEQTRHNIFTDIALAGINCSLVTSPHRVYKNVQKGFFLTSFPPLRFIVVQFQDKHSPLSSNQRWRRRSGRYAKQFILRSKRAPVPSSTLR